MDNSQLQVNYLEIEPVTGVLTKMNRTYTMVLSVYCFDRSTISTCTVSNPLPFPSLLKYNN